MPTSDSGRQRQFVTFGCSHSAPKCRDGRSAGANDRCSFQRLSRRRGRRSSSKVDRSFAGKTAAGSYGSTAAFRGASKRTCDELTASSVGFRSGPAAGTREVANVSFEYQLTFDDGRWLAASSLQPTLPGHAVTGGSWPIAAARQRPLSEIAQQPCIRLIQLEVVEPEADRIGDGERTGHAICRAMEEGNYRRGDELSCIRRHRAYPAIFSFSPPFRSAPIIR